VIATEIQRALTAVTEIATVLGLRAGETAVLHNSNKLTLRLLPCDTVARVAHVGREVAQFEVDLAQQLARSASPVAVLAPGVEPRVYERDGFAVTFWTCYQPLPNELKPGDYADALARLHAGMRNVDLPSPHFTDRIAEAQEIVANHEQSPALAEADRELLGSALGRLKEAVTRPGTAEQLLHGEPHPGNVLDTARGPVFIDLETCCRGPIEFDLAHAPAHVSDHYAGIDQELLRDCRVLVLAMVAAWRWDRDDQFPNGLEMGRELLAQVRGMLES
jgi:aminoglycoside phosphotransferase (APT) family kinase protein